MEFTSFMKETELKIFFPEVNTTVLLASGILDSVGVDADASRLRKWRDSVFLS